MQRPIISVSRSTSPVCPFRRRNSHEHVERKLGLTLVAAALVTVYGCGKEEPKKAAEAPEGRPPPPAEEVVTVKIGHAGPLTGGIAHLGKDDENGVRLAVDEATARKIKIGGKTVKFELMSEDDQADPKMGPTIAQKFVDAKVAGVVGHLNSGVSIPASAVYNQAGIPMISGSATNPKLTEQGFKTVFRTVGRDDQQGPAVAAVPGNSMKVKKVAIADDATAYGEGLANEVEKTLKAAGVQVVAREKTTDKTTDFKAILTKMKGKSAGRDLLRRHGRHRRPDAQAGARARHQERVRVRRRRVHRRDGEARRRGGGRPDLLASRPAGLGGQQGVQRRVQGEVRRGQAVRAVLLRRRQPHDRGDAEGGLDRPGQVPAGDLQKISYNGATGEIEFDEKGDRKNAEITIFTLKDGKVVPVGVVKAGKASTFDDFMKRWWRRHRQRRPRRPRLRRPRRPRRRRRRPPKRPKK